jgi:hypothetical protein
MSDQSEWLKNNQRQLDADGVEVGVSRQALDELIALSEAQERWLKIMMGVLCEYEHTAIYITHKDQQWNLITVVKTDGGLVHEVLCRHEDFAEFMKLVHEHSDYVEGE